ncbi:MAG TPA: hypothetical protein VL492_08870 [Methylovirgula sp.]|jgi:hypothetical protein|nr:hypothetical protein [Methylovirgula sp.]
MPMTLIVPLALVFGGRPVLAQEQPAAAPDGGAQPASKPASKPAKPPKPYGGGTPLDVILSTKFWVDPPKEQPFVEESRPDPSSLHYQPTVGSDPKRAPLLDKSQLGAMQQDLEASGAVNEKAAGVKSKNFAGVAPAGKSKPRKEKKEKPKRLSAEEPTPLH